MQIISFKNVSYSYSSDGKAALSCINLSLETGEFLAVMGETGCGKTTLCRLINGIIPHAYEDGSLTGTVTVNGVCTLESSVAVLAKTAGLVLDDPDAQLFTSSVCSEAAFGPENLLVPSSEIEERVKEALASVGLIGMEERLPSSLSGGEKQRLVIASFLTMKTKILILDEPLSRLDPLGAEKVMQVLKTLQEKYRITVIITAHDSKMMKKYTDKVCILKEGKIAALDTAEKILSDHKLLEENGIQPPQYYDIQSHFSLFEPRTPNPEPHTLNPKPYTPLQINNLSFSYCKKLLINNINLTFNNNEITAIIGHNGCGKTTLLKNIAGLLHPESGDILINNKNTKKMTVSDISKEIGFVMQNPDNQLFTDSVYKEVSFALKNQKLSKDEIKKRTKDALNTAGLQDWDAFPHALNRADRTKLVIACVIAMGCKILLFDEVDVGQDYNGSTKIMNIANELVSKGYTIIFVTHNMSLVCKYAHRLIVMEKDGKISEWKRIR